MLAATFVAVVGLPILVPAFVVADLARARRHLPSVRVYLFVTQYAINDSAEILIAPWYWLLAGFGTRLDSRASIRRHQRIQEWSVVVLARRGEQRFGVRVEVDDESLQALEPAPAIVLCRHVNVLDASLPSLLYRRIGIQIRGVIMAELLADPGFDLLYRRLGSIFIARDNGAEARSAIRDLGTKLDGSTVAVIFPEGRLYRPDVLERVKAKIATSDPGRARQLSGLRHVLPIRPGGVNALLDAAPAADLVVIAHTGLDDYSDFRSLARRVPLTTPLVVSAWRTPRGAVPTDPTERADWLDHAWQAVDDWIDMRRIRPE
jgi:1-acyl-sn-glycerol-3-phosphate acyltransferase